MAKTKYPIEHQPTNALLDRIKNEADPIWVITDLVFVQWAQTRWQVRFTWGQQGNTLRMETEIGGKEKSLLEIENRFINSMKVGGKI